MAKIEMCDVEPGMVLAADLKAWNGRLLLRRGIRLTPECLKTMTTWGVVEADIEGISGNDVDAKRTAHIDRAVFEAADRLTRKRFMHTDLEHEVVRRLFEICVLRKAHEMSKGVHPDSPEQIFDQSAGLNQNPFVENTVTKINPQKLFGSKIKLPSLPVIFSQITEAINDPRSSATQVASIIEKDSSLSARLLKIVNSAFYGFPSRIDTISRAVTIIGTKELSILAMGISALEVFKDIPSDLIDMKSFWKHNIACGTIARIIASYHNNTVTERFFLAGLLHDIGRLMMFKFCPLEAKEALVRASRTNSLLRDTEEEVMGFDHALIGGMLLKHWNLPVVLETSVAHHHTWNTRTGSQPRLERAVAHLSDIITNGLGIGTSGEQFVPPLDQRAWEEIGLPVGVLSATINQADSHIADTIHICFPNE
jgi:HD-like signal output (HDOD) protein